MHIYGVLEPQADSQSQDPTIAMPKDNRWAEFDTVTE